MTVPYEVFCALEEDYHPLARVQWLETEARLFKAYLDTVEISEALNAINTECQERERSIVRFVFFRLAHRGSQLSPAQPSAFHASIISIPDPRGGCLLGLP